MSRNKDSYTINSVSRAFNTLEVLTRGPIGVTDLANTMGVHKNFAFRVLASLVATGFVEQEEVTERYRLTPKLELLAGNASLQNASKIADLAAQIIRATEHKHSTDNRVEMVVESDVTTNIGE